MHSNAENVATVAGQERTLPAEARPGHQQRAAELVAEIAADAAEQPHAYLRETVVPEGGE